MQAAMIDLGFDFTAMASSCEVRAQAPDEGRLREAVQAAIQEVRRIETKYSRYRGDSVVAGINAAAGTGRPHLLDAETGDLLDFADRLHRISEGRFDITSGGLRRCWDFAGARVPSRADVAAALQSVGSGKLVRRAGAIELPVAGMEIDLGGIGKEYACDRAAAVLLRSGISHGYVNLGGDVRVLGPRGDGQAWTFGIQHPREPTGLIGAVSLCEGALATSGDYERFFERDGRRYCHLLDARTGWPVDSWQSISVVAPTCSAAGAASTLACLLGAGAESFLESQGLAYLAVDAHGRIHRHGMPQAFGIAASASSPLTGVSP